MIGQTGVDELKFTVHGWIVLDGGLENRKQDSHIK